MPTLPILNWKILNTDTSRSPIDVILQNRGLSVSHLESFRLSERLHNPYLLKDMKKAVDRIKKAIQNREPVAIYGDYDVDGIVSTVLMLKFFEKINHPVDYFIPDRDKDGYGLKPNGVREVGEGNFGLLLTVDNGITSFEAVAQANKENIDVIITDHHLQEGPLPEAVAVINPNRQDCNYPFKGLCGAGVVYKLLQALSMELFEEQEYKTFMLNQLDLIALATIADVCPILDENYALVKFGLKSLTKTMRPGLVELKRVSGILGKEITPTAVGFQLGPRLNVAGRLEHASLGVKLLTSTTREEAADRAHYLNQLNIKRQQLQEEYLGQAIDGIQTGISKDDNVYIVDNKGWQSGLIGIISGKLKDMYNRPVLVFTQNPEGNYVGSARSIDNFHITDALSKFKHYYLNYGGHQKAAGLTIPSENFVQFKQDLTEYINSSLQEEDKVGELIIDSVVDAVQLNESLVKTIREIGPFGESNPEPVFLLRNGKIKEIKLLSNGKHLKTKIQIGSRSFECLWWNRGDLKNDIRFNMEVDLAFKPSLNLWNGLERLQLIVADMIKSA